MTVICKACRVLWDCHLLPGGRVSQMHCLECRGKLERVYLRKITQDQIKISLLEKMKLHFLGDPPYLLVYVNRSKTNYYHKGEIISQFILTP